MSEPHPCPFTVGELMALYATQHTRGNTQLAAKVLAHTTQHTPPQRLAEHHTPPQQPREEIPC